MKKSWMVFFLMPILTFAAYPIYEDDSAPHQSKPPARESSTEKDLVTSEKSIKEPIQEKGEDKVSQKYSRKQRLKDRSILRDKKKIGAQTKSESSSSEKQQPSISKRDSVKRNSPLPSNTPRVKRRQNPNRPQVIHRDDKKKSQELSKIEADAEEIEEGLSAHQSEEWADSESKP